MQFGWQQKIARAVSPMLAIGAAALVLFVTLSPAHAETSIFPQVMPEEISALREQADALERGRHRQRPRRWRRASRS